MFEAFQLPPACPMQCCSISSTCTGTFTTFRRDIHCILHILIVPQFLLNSHKKLALLQQEAKPLPEKDPAAYRPPKAVVKNFHDGIAHGTSMPCNMYWRNDAGFILGHHSVARTLCSGEAIAIRLEATRSYYSNTISETLAGDLENFATSWRSGRPFHRCLRSPRGGSGCPKTACWRVLLGFGSRTRVTRPPGQLLPISFAAPGHQFARHSRDLAASSETWRFRNNPETTKINKAMLLFGIVFLVFVFF